MARPSDGRPIVLNVACQERLVEASGVAYHRGLQRQRVAGHQLLGHKSGGTNDGGTLGHASGQVVSQGELRPRHVEQLEARPQPWRGEAQVESEEVEIAVGLPRAANHVAL
jgi:hypothetical protein